MTVDVSEPKQCSSDGDQNKDIVRQTPGLWLLRPVVPQACGSSGLWSLRPVVPQVCGSSGLWFLRSVAPQVCGPQASVTSCGTVKLSAASTCPSVWLDTTSSITGTLGSITTLTMQPELRPVDRSVSGLAPGPWMSPGLSGVT
ncbi:hypothetical protein INR49_000023 [Caranx melampygus]|nr:hypothetical protein INR49_000023 [Caranx melampygus]